MSRLVLLLLLLIPTLALAHKPSDSYLSLTVEDGGTLSGQWDIALRDLERAVGVDRNRDAAITWGELKASRDELRDHILSRLTVTARNEDRERVCVLDNVDLKVDDHVDGAYAVFLLNGDCGMSPLALTLNYRFLFDRDASHQGLVDVRFGDGSSQAVALSNAHETTATRAPLMGRRAQRRLPGRPQRLICTLRRASKPSVTERVRTTRASASSAVKKYPAPSTSQ